jgi:hypothetical protein
MLEERKKMTEAPKPPVAATFAAKTTSPLTPKQRFAELNAMYQKANESKKFSCLISGNLGSGKTRVACTGRKPVLLIQFDPGGAKSVQQQIDKGEVIPMDFSDDDPAAPYAYKKFEKFFNEEVKAGLLKSTGTLVLDSITTMSDIMMNEILRQEGQLGKMPRIQDYGKQILFLQQAIKFMISQPCDFVCTGHIALTKDEVSGKVHSGLLITGKANVKIPLLFDEIYVAKAEKLGPTEAQKLKTDMRYSLLTRPDGIYDARTRIGSGKLQALEEPDLKKILAKCGYPTADVELV